MTPIIFLLLLLLLAVPASLSSSGSGRILHQPFFPVTDSPPPSSSSSSSPSPSPSPSPFSSQTPRFFPLSTSPSSTSTSLPTFPANISSINILPPSKSHVSTKLLFLSLILSILSIAFIAAVLASVLYHRNHSYKPPASDSLRLFPPNLSASDKPSPPSLPHNFSTPSSDFLYEQTLTNAHRSLGSPELHPLPPLPRHGFPASPAPVKLPPGLFTSENELTKQETLKPKLKALHWDKVRANSDKATVWDHLKLSSSQLDEEMVETLFMANSSKLAPNQEREASTMAADMLLDLHKYQNMAILLRAFNLTIDEVCECILQGNVDTLGSEVLGSLLKMAPTMEEEVRLKEMNDAPPFKIGPAEIFLRAVMDIPFAFKRVDAMLYISNFDTEVDYLKRSFQTIESACEQLRNSRMFIKLLEAVLKAGSRMNIGTNRGDARAFKLDMLVKLVDVKGTDGKTTLLHFVVQEIIRAEGCRLSRGDRDHDILESELCDEVEFRKLGLQVVSSLSGELSSVKKAATMDSDLLSKEVGRLAMGVTKISEVVGLNERLGSNQRFSDSMNAFLKKAEDDIMKIEAEERVSTSMVKETTEYFHGNLAKEEAQPLRIFMVVRDFLLVLDQVCKEVGKLNERTIIGSCGPPMNPTFPRFNRWQQPFRSPDGEDGTTASASA